MATDHADSGWTRTGHLLAAAHNAPTTAAAKHVHYRTPEPTSATRARSACGNTHQRALDLAVTAATNGRLNALTVSPRPPVEALRQAADHHRRVADRSGLATAMGLLARTGRHVPGHSATSRRPPSSSARVADRQERRPRKANCRPERPRTPPLVGGRHARRPTTTRRRCRSSESATTWRTDARVRGRHHCARAVPTRPTSTIGGRCGSHTASPPPRRTEPMTASGMANGCRSP